MSDTPKYIEVLINLYSLTELICGINLFYIVTQSNKPRFHELLFNLVQFKKIPEIKKISYSKNSDNLKLLTKSYAACRKRLQEVKEDFIDKKKKFLDQSNEFSNCCLIAFNFGIYLFISTSSFRYLGIPIISILFLAILSLIFQLIFFIADFFSNEALLSKSKLFVAYQLVFVLVIGILFAIQDNDFLEDEIFHKIGTISSILTIFFPTLAYGLTGVFSLSILKNKNNHSIKEAMNEYKTTVSTIEDYDEMLEKANSQLSSLPKQHSK